MKNAFIRQENDRIRLSSENMARQATT